MNPALEVSRVTLGKTDILEKGATKDQEAYKVTQATPDPPDPKATPVPEDTASEDLKASPARLANPDPWASDETAATVTTEIQDFVVLQECKDLGVSEVLKVIVTLRIAKLLTHGGLSWLNIRGLIWLLKGTLKEMKTLRSHLILG